MSSYCATAKSVTFASIVILPELHMLGTNVSSLSANMETMQRQVSVPRSVLILERDVLTVTCATDYRIVNQKVPRRRSFAVLLEWVALVSV